MRLIDADELRGCAIPCEIHNGTLTEMCVPLYQIDNAPTIDISETISKFRNTAYQNGFTTGLNKRPQGEWKLHGMIYYCSECGHDCEQGGNNFCGNCGADMRGKEE